MPAAPSPRSGGPGRASAVPNPALSPAADLVDMREQVGGVFIDPESAGLLKLSDHSRR